MTFGQITENKNINILIYRCFENLPDLEQRKFVRKFRDQPKEGSQVMHTLAELICGAYVANWGYHLIYEFDLNRKTPDWCIMEDKIFPKAFMDVVTIHIDQETNNEIDRQLHSRGIAAYWMNGNRNNVDRLYSTIQNKTIEYRELANTLRIPFVIAVHADFRTQFEEEEIIDCLHPEGYGIFSLYSHLSGVLYFENHGSQYAFRYFENFNSVWNFSVQDGLYP